MIQNGLISRHSWRFIVVGILLLGVIAVGTAYPPRVVHADPARLPENRPAALDGICDSVTTIPRSECDALVAFYNETAGPHWTFQGGWLQTATPCSWYGVQCKAGHVNSLVLKSNRLSGMIPPALVNLPLETVSFYNNDLVGSIPPELGSMTSLASLSLSRNRLGGSIPGELSGLVNLKYLLLDYNMLSGEIPSALAYLPKLAALSVSYNMLTASDPTLIALLDRYGSQWRTSQTVPPSGVAAGTILRSSVEITWDRFLQGTGYYEVGYSTLPGGPYASGCLTPDKTTTRCTVRGLIPDTPYYFAVRTYTPTSTYQKNELWSAFGGEIPVRTSNLAFTCDAVTQIPYAECEALDTLFNQTNGPYWKNSTNWQGDITPCTWAGVTCGGGHVIALRLDYNGLSGNLPAELGNLSQLVSLSLSENDLTGSLPASLGNLVNLKRLDLGYNLLTGSIPSSLGNLTSLETLSLRGNDLSGSIPPALGNLAQLRVLMLDKNRLSGAIPPEIGNLSRLEILYLQANQLSGAIPPELGNLSALAHLYLYGNRLSGTIPPELGNLSQLTRLFLMANQLEGEIPPELANLSQLQLASTTFNMLWTDDPAVQALLNRTDSPLWSSTQTVPPAGLTLGDLTARYAEFTWNPVVYTGDGGYYEVGYATEPGGPYTVGCRTASKATTGCTIYDLRPGQTYYFAVRTYTPSHSYPLNDFWPQQNALWSPYSAALEVSTHEHFCDVVSEIPDSECEALEAFYDDNYDSDVFPGDGISNWLQSTTPCTDWNGVVCDAGHVTELQVHGSSPASGGLSGTLSPELGQLTYLETLDLGDNQLTGEFPIELTTLEHLRVLDLAYNQLEGEIPPEIGHLTELVHLDLTCYNWTGVMPPEIGSLTHLKHLAVASNYLTGPIPSEYFQLTNLTRLFLHSVDFGGPIPPEIGNLTQLTDLMLSGGLQGPIPLEITTLPHLTFLSLTGGLDGSIPPEIGNLTQLSFLMLAQNHLSGPIPTEIGSLTQLQDISLSCNRLEGEVPPSFAALTRLGRHYVFNGVDYNMLTSSDPAVIARLEAFDPTWDETQTIPPENVQVALVDPVQVRVSWTPILYTADGGYYEVLVSTTPGGPYTEGCRTADKTESSCIVRGLKSFTTYYFVMRTFTPANQCGNFIFGELGQPNDLLSAYSEEVTITAGEYVPPAGCYPLESDPSVILCTSR